MMPHGLESSAPAAAHFGLFRPGVGFRQFFFDETGDPNATWLAEGRDPSATIDSATGGFGKNEGDNEITGAHVSDGDPSTAGILGARNPQLGNGHWRWFYTQQHGDNPTYEVTLRQHGWSWF
jgi:hypothetical protein